MYLRFFSSPNDIALYNRIGEAKRPETAKDSALNQG